MHFYLFYKQDEQGNNTGINKYIKIDSQHVIIKKEYWQQKSFSAFAQPDINMREGVERIGDSYANLRQS